MADDLQGKPLSEFSTASIVSDDTLFFASKPNDLTNTGYDTVGVPGSTLKNLLNEELYVDLTSTLAIGETSLTFNDARITSTSVIDIYTDTFGVNPTAVTTSTGSITLTFSEQEAVVSVKVRLWLSDRGANSNTYPFKSVSWEGEGTEPRLIEIPIDDINCWGFISAERIDTSLSTPINRSMPFFWGAGNVPYADEATWVTHSVTYNADNIMRIAGYPNHVGQIFNMPNIRYTFNYIVLK